ncbi:MAG: hypothetical protein MZU79_00550 [Anaerotruncus sp.]|nr:hypothetical protein [Anaerotruncus sp.]
MARPGAPSTDGPARRPHRARRRRLRGRARRRRVRRHGQRHARQRGAGRGRALAAAAGGTGPGRHQRHPGRGQRGVPARARGVACGRGAPGKDSTTGHWELCGLVLGQPFPTYPAGFPAAVVGEFARRTGRGVLGNRAASGTAILEELGEEHRRTGSWIVYTSADSVFQVAAHEETVPLEELYRACELAREMLAGPHAVSRVIAAAVHGPIRELAAQRGRRDWSVPPPGPTLLDRLAAAERAGGGGQGGRSLREPRHHQPSRGDERRRPSR